MYTLSDEVLGWGYERYVGSWERVVEAARERVMVDAAPQGWRYVSLGSVVLAPEEARALRRLSERIAPLLDRAARGIAEDRAWWPLLAWPRPAIELARQEVAAATDGPLSLYGRLDWLRADDGTWQLAEFNADTPSGGREAAGLEPAVARLYEARFRAPSIGLEDLLAAAIGRRLTAWRARRRGEAGGSTVGIISAHSWVEDMAQAWWLGRLLDAHGHGTVVGDVSDLEVGRSYVTLRGRPIDALYRFYPVEDLYRHAIFARLIEAALDRRILLLNGLGAFLAQSKAVLAWLWEHRGDRRLGRGTRALLEAHLPAVLPLRHPRADALRSSGMIKHVNGREGESVLQSAHLSDQEWENRRIDGGYVLQRLVRQQPLPHVEIDEMARTLLRVEPRFACVGAFVVDGRFGGFYTRLDGPITGPRAHYSPTVVLPPGAGALGLGA